jgi:hypothetical protein
MTETRLGNVGGTDYDARLRGYSCRRVGSLSFSWGGPLAAISFASKRQKLALGRVSSLPTAAERCNIEQSRE